MSFKLYIFSDGENSDVDEIIKKYQTHDLVTYIKFEKNLGRISLADQWNRCISLVNSEWIWLFSDDDVADSNCVQELMHELTKSDFSVNLMRFQVGVIDQNKNILKGVEKVNKFQSDIDFVKNRLNSAQSSFACEYVFRRKIWFESGGFVNFPLAWYADDASWIKFSNGTDILTIFSAKVYWRISNVNISGASSKDSSVIKSKACIEYLVWLKKYFDQGGRLKIYDSLVPKHKRIIWYFRNVYTSRRYNVVNPFYYRQLIRNYRYV